MCIGDICVELLKGCQGASERCAYCFLGLSCNTIVEFICLGGWLWLFWIGIVWTPSFSPTLRLCTELSGEQELRNNGSLQHHCCARTFSLALPAEMSWISKSQESRA
jgi:hypothetical protein